MYTYAVRESLEKDLRTLAKRLDLSLGATSELMRRGEATIISSYIDSLISDTAET